MIAPECCPLCGTPGPRLMVAHIQAIVAAYYDMPVHHMTSAQRGWRYSHPRQVAMYLASELTHRSLPDIGLRFRRDHTTVLYAVRAIAKRMQTDAELTRDVKALMNEIAPLIRSEQLEMAA